MTRRTAVPVEFELGEILELLYAANTTRAAYRNLGPHFAPFAALLESAHRKLDEAWTYWPDRHDPRAVAEARSMPCPACSARPGLLCVDAQGRDLPYLHADRFASAAHVDAIAGVVLDRLDGEV